MFFKFSHRQSVFLFGGILGLGLSVFFIGKSLFFNTPQKPIGNLVENPVVSVVLSTYNRADLLPTAIDSILTQTYDNFELIVINDGSTDDTPKVLKKYQKKDPRLIVLTNEENKGLVFSLNRGIEAARGKYIARMDDDDVSIPERFQIQVNFLDKHPEITVIGSYESWLFSNSKIENNMMNILSQESLKLSFNPTKEDLTETVIESYFKVPIFHPSAMIRKEFLNNHNIRYSERFPSAEDTPFWHEIILKGGSIVRYPTFFSLRGNSEKKKNYHKQQLNSYHHFLDESLAGIVPEKSFHGWPKEDQFCQILNAMRSHVGKKPALTHMGIDRLMQKYECHKFIITAK